MLNSAACRMKTARAPAGEPACEKSSMSKGLTLGHRARYRRAEETSRNTDLASSHMSHKKKTELLMARSEDYDTEGISLGKAGGGQKKRKFLVDPGIYCKTQVA